MKELKKLAATPHFVHPCFLEADGAEVRRTGGWHLAPPLSLAKRFGLICCSLRDFHSNRPIISCDKLMAMVSELIAFP
jgi:hypothetical protein